METVEVLIKIPKDLYEFVKEKDKEEKFALWDDKWKEAAIANGTVLPKGHGRLKDYDVIKGEYIRKMSVFMNEEERMDLLCGIIDDAPTVIEADREAIEK